MAGYRDRLRHADMWVFVVDVMLLVRRESKVALVPTMLSGTFYEGAIVAGYPSDATDDAVQSNVVSAGYGK
jgi:Alpha-L-arabinofuranosidase B, catalytic